MNENLAKQILKIFANNPFDAYNHKQVSSRIGAGSKAERQEVIRTIQELAEQKHLVEDSHKGKYKINPKSINDELMPQNYVTGTRKAARISRLLPTTHTMPSMVIPSGC